MSPHESKGRPLPAGCRIVRGAVIAAGLWAAAAAAAEPAGHAGVLDLVNEGFLLGRLVPLAGEPGQHRTTLLWQSPLFAEPLEFPVDGIERIRFPRGRAEAARADAWRVELRSGDFVEGSLVGIDADHVVLRVDGVGEAPLRIRRAAIERLGRASATARTIVPGGIAGWDAARGAWREQAGGLVCDAAGATCHRDVAAPPRACFDLVLSWGERPDLEIVFAAGAEEVARLKDGAAGKALAKSAEEYRVEALAGDLLAVREGATAKFDRAGTIPAGPGGVHLRVFVDQERGRMAVVLPTGEAAARPVFDESLPPRKFAPRAGFALRLRDGSVRIDKLRITPWTDPEPRVDDGPPAVIESFNPTTGTFTVRGDDGPRPVAAADVTDLEFPADALEPQPAPGSVIVTLHGRTRLTGRIVAVTPATLHLECGALADPLACELKQLAMLEPRGSRRPGGLPGRPGLLEGDGCRMLGCLTNAGGPTTGIAWLPRGAAGGAALAASAADPLRVTYRGLDLLGGVGFSVDRRGDAWVVAEIVGGGPAARDGRIGAGWKLESIQLPGDAGPIAVQPLEPDEVRGLLRGVIGSTVRLRLTDPAGQAHDMPLVLEAGGRGDLAGEAAGAVLAKSLAIHAARAKQGAPAGGGQSTVFLKTGDAVLGTVLAAGPQGLRLKTEADPDILVPAIAIRAVELLPEPKRAIAATKFARLLTLPRMQQADPPTHMLRLLNGDYLRGKLVALDERVVRVDVLGVIKELPRAEVARLIWLSREGDSAEAEAVAAIAGEPGPGGVPVRATMTDNRWLTMTAERVEGDRLLGRSGVLGAVGVTLGKCERLELHPSATATPPASLPYGQWRLKPADVPRALRTPAANAAAVDQPPAAGETTRPVGRVAPVPTLPLLEPAADGRKRIHPADWEGRIVVLSVFKATDGDGLAGLPELAAALEPLAASGVICIGVGTRDAADVISKAVSGLPRRPPIAVDQAGNLESWLGKPALPTCLIIDREGREAAVLPSGPGKTDAIRTRVQKLVDASQGVARDFAALAQAREAALAQDRGCLESLGGLLQSDSEAVRTRTARLLRELTGLGSRDMPFGPGGPREQRAKEARQWRQWIAVRGISVDLAFPQRGGTGAAEDRPIVGRTLVCRPQPGDCVELDAEGKEVFRVPARQGWGCDILPNGHRLVAGFVDRSVVEYDENGKEVWAVRNLIGGPMSARRLENGNTLVALSDANLVAEYDPQGQVAWSATVAGRPCDARRVAAGVTLVAAHKANRIVEVDAGGKELWAVDGIEDPQTAQRLPNGNTLVAMSVPGIVREIDRDGRTVWERAGFRVPVDVQRLPDGTTLVQEMGLELVELDAQGTEIKRRHTGGSRILRW